VHAAAARARAAAEGAPVTIANANTDALNPEFRARLARVMTRMHDEYGHTVELVEGFRPQARQDYLFDQGRTRPGPVVTWTRSSRHTLGLAADLKIDGSYGDPAAYRQLAQVAAQEGLRTLGARDPGHVELAAAGAAALEASTLNAPGHDTMARALELALGQENATTNRAGGVTADSLNALLSRVTHGGATAPGPLMFGRGFNSGVGAGGSGAGGSMMQDNRGRGGQPADGAAPATVASTARVATVADVAQVASVAAVAAVAHPGSAAPVTAHVSGTAPALPAAGAASAERVGRLLDVRDATPAQPLSRVTLAVDNNNGGADHITVNMRGGAVDTVINTANTARADTLSLRAGELQRALEHHGLEAGSIQVGATSPDSGAGWTPRHDGEPSANDGRLPADHRDTHRQDADEPRQRSRREQQGGKR